MASMYWHSTNVFKHSTAVFKGWFFRTSAVFRGKYIHWQMLSLIELVLKGHSEKLLLGNISQVTKFLKHSNDPDMKGLQSHFLT